MYKMSVPENVKPLRGESGGEVRDVNTQNLLNSAMRHKVRKMPARKFFILFLAQVLLKEAGHYCPWMI